MSRRIPSLRSKPYTADSDSHQHPRARVSRSRIRDAPGRPSATDSCLSDDAVGQSQPYYDRIQDPNHRLQQDVTYAAAATDQTFSDSSSANTPRYGNDDFRSFRRQSRNYYAPERSYHKGRDKVTPSVHKSLRRVYPNHPQVRDGRVYQHEAEAPVICEDIAARRPPVSRLSDRPQSSLSSGVASAIVDGCGGKCQTFENICYFFLQLIFMMGILIGVSLCIAGMVLRKSAARNLQVLVYIGILLASVSMLLLGIQWNARKNAKKRKLAKRAPIPLETFYSRVNQPHLMMVQDGQRAVAQIVRPCQPDQQGVPWWRRRDLN